ncbi:MAG: hypothetical protein M1479_06990 [Actinobacteria bacterium]|nr:hypothetical protein [Actinomycetota bacterium]
MLKIPFNNPKPDFENFVNVLNGKKEADKVYVAELQIDEEVKKYIIENYFNEKNFAQQDMFSSKSIKNHEDESENENYFRHLINFYYRMGYDFLADFKFIQDYNSLNKTTKVGQDNEYQELARKDRHWVQSESGMIKDWEDFDKFPWDKFSNFLNEFEKHVIFMKKNLPEGMKLTVVGCVFQAVIHWLLGYEVVFYKIYDDEKLVEEVFNKIGQITYDYYEIALSFDCVGGIFHTDDLGFKSSTVFSPKQLRRFFFPWLKKYVSLAHDSKKPFWLHCCGFKDEIINDLINDIKIDALHSFEDACCPVIKYKKLYGDKIGIIGGVDVDKLARLHGNKLRKYIRNILDICLPGGRFALGSGNSITNYIPIKNYIILLEEGLNYKF